MIFSPVSPSRMETRGAWMVALPAFICYTQGKSRGDTRTTPDPNRADRRAAWVPSAQPVME
jgi:hypothetical protein